MDTRQRYRYGNKLSAVSVPIVMAWFIIAKDILVLRFGRTHTAATFLYITLFLQITAIGNTNTDIIASTLFHIYVAPFLIHAFIDFI